MAQQAERVVGFDCEFVEPPPEHLIQSECPVCLQIIRDPYQVTCCGNKFCQSCIHRIKADNKPCPTCQAKEINTFPDVGLKRSLYSFKVLCSHQNNGCEWTGELGQFDIHLNIDPQPEKQLDGCQFAEINCTCDCGAQLQRRYIQTHQIEHCTKRPFSCDHCHNYESNFDDVIHNHWPVCGSFPLRCPNECGLKLQRQNVDCHVADECPLTTISCDFLHVGCVVKLPRKDMSEHLRDNVLLHISLLATKQQAEFTKQQSEITEQKAQIASLVAENDQLKSKNTNLEHNLLAHETNFAALRAEVTSVKQENESLKSKIEATPRTTIPMSLPVLTMTNYEQHKRNDDVWFSSPVYTHHQGYKFCLGIEANGPDFAKERYLCVNVHFMKGEFDNSQKWPFRGVISLQLLDQLNGKDHITMSVVYENTTENRFCSRVTKGKRAEYGAGCILSIAHFGLTPKYLQNNTLLFQLEKVELR